MSEIRANTISDAAGTGPATLTKQSAAKMWCQASNAPAINDSFNVTSLTDVGTGKLTYNLTSNMSSASYAFNASAQLTTIAGTGCFSINPLITSCTASSCRSDFYENGSLSDGANWIASINGDLA